MQHLLNESLGEVGARLAASPRVSLSLDFDGTLVPIVQDRLTSVLDGHTRTMLSAIIHTHRAVISVISGRTIDDVTELVGVEGVVYAGNHGLEILGRDLEFIEPTAFSSRHELEELSTRLAEALEGIPGANVEYKRLSATVHYRQAADKDVPAVQQAVQDVVGAWTRFRFQRGLKSFEIIPRTFWDKGAAIRWINYYLGVSEKGSIYIGDDQTDEDVFYALSEGITVRVGPSSPTRAHYGLNDTGEVQGFLEWLAHSGLHQRVADTRSA